MRSEIFHVRNIFFLLFISILGSSSAFGQLKSGTIGTTGLQPLIFMTNNVAKMSISLDGEVTVGTTIPYGKFTVMSSGQWMGICHTDQNVVMGTQIYGENALFGTKSSHALNFMVIGQPQMTIDVKGNVGIGTTSPGTYKLAVEGMIGARAIEVKASSWADFVFNKNYKLKPLKEVEDFINAHKHLPDVPSEEEVKKDGINVGNMNAILLQKIEELTLYAIEQNKRIEAIERENASLKKKLIRK